MAWPSYYCHERYLYPGPYFSMSPHSAAAHCPYLSRRFILPVMNQQEGISVADTYDSWKYTLVVHWSCHDVLYWLINQLYELGVKNVPAVKLEHLGLDNINGTTLKHLSLGDFRKLIPEHGDELYHSLQSRLDYEARAWTTVTSVRKVYVPLEVAHRPPSPYQVQGNDLTSISCVESWAEKSIDSWAPSDTLEWLLSQLLRLGVKDPAALRLEHFNNTSGHELVRLSLADFTHRLPSHGDQLYHQLQVKIQAESQFTAGEIDLTVHHRRDVSPSAEGKGEEPNFNNTEEKSSLKENIQPANTVKKTKAQDREKVGRVWEFIRELLLDSRYRDVISWVDREAGLFRFENSAKAAKLWGDRKGNSLMNFKKFSRAISCNMPSIQGPTTPRLMDDFTSYESSHEWSIFKANAVLDSQSFYEDHELFRSNSDIGFSPITETPPKLIKTEPLSELVPADFQHFAWQSKYIDYWQPQDCLFWLINELQELKVSKALPEVKMERIAHIDGVAFKNMSLDEFRWMFPDYGDVLFNRLQKYKSSVNNYYSFDQWHTAPVQRDEHFAPPPEAHTLTDLDIEPNPPTLPPPTYPTTSLPYCSPSAAEGDSGYKSDSSEESIPEPPPPEKRRPGRPRGTRKKKKPEKLGRLWEFIRDLLLNPLYNPSMICWENYEEGTFRFVHSDKVAKLWGSKKDNGDMNYEKLSRAMRYYYKSQVLLPVYGKRLVYKFGPTATGWRSERPIFRQA